MLGARFCPKHGERKDAVLRFVLPVNATLSYSEYQLNLQARCMRVRRIVVKPCPCRMVIYGRPFGMQSRSIVALGRARPVPGGRIPARGRVGTGCCSDTERVRRVWAD